MNRLFVKCAAGAALFAVCGAVSAQNFSCPDGYLSGGGRNHASSCNLARMATDWSAKQASVQRTLNTHTADIDAAKSDISILKTERAKISDVTDLTKLVKNLTESAARLEKKIKETESQLAALEQRVDALKKP
jgi:chromosome segregation ATPase